MKNIVKILLATLALVALTVSASAFSLFGKSAEDTLIGTWTSVEIEKDNLSDNMSSVISDCKETFSKDFFVGNCLLSIEYSFRYRPAHTNREKSSGAVLSFYHKDKYIPDANGKYKVEYKSKITYSGRWSIEENIFTQIVDSASGAFVGLKNTTNYSNNNLRAQGRALADGLASAFKKVFISRIDSYNDNEFHLTDKEDGKKSTYKKYDEDEDIEYGEDGM